MQTRTAHYRDSPNLQSSTQVYFGRRADDAPGVHLVRISREHWQPHFSIPWRRAQGHGLGLLLVVDGQGHFSDGEQAVTLQAGDVVFAGPSGSLRIDNDPRHSLEWLMVYLGGRGCARVLRQEFGLRQPWLRPRRPHAIQRAFEHCFAAGLEGGPLAEDICLGLTRVILRSLRNDLAAGDDGGGNATCFAAKGLIDTRFRELARVEDVARACGVSRAWLDRLFKTHLSCTPRDYLLATRMHYAAHRLQVSDEPIRAIAAELGYADQYAFSRAFKRHFGRAPSHYRQA